MHKKYGLCLTGGGGRGAYQIGAAQALKELGIFDKIEVFSGTSIGAANMVILASNGIEKAKKVWFTMPENKIPKNDSHDNQNYRRMDLEKGIYSMERFEKVIRDNVNYDLLKKKETYVTVSDFGVPSDSFFHIFKASYQHYISKDSKVVYVPMHTLDDKNAHRAIIASCSIPILFPPVTIEDKKYYDGGVFDKIPVTPLIEAGCNEIIIVHLHRKRYNRPKNLSENITIHEIRRPKGYPGRVMKFNLEHTQNMYEWGYEDTLNYFKEKG